MVIEGVRFSANDRIYIDGSLVSIKSKDRFQYDVTSHGFKLPELSAGYHKLQISNKNGMSNIVGFEVTGNTTQPSIVITDKSGNQGITVNVGDTFILQGKPEGLEGLEYWTVVDPNSNSLPSGNYFSRALFFDPIFTDSCSSNEATGDNIWTFTCKAKTTGVGSLYVEIYKDGQTYKSNIVTVTIPSPTSPAITSCVFDPIKYADHYPDLKRAFGYNKAKLKDHWLKYGIKEGRTPCGSVMSSCKFNATDYVNLHADVKLAKVDGLNHYTKYGVNEGRVVCQIGIINPYIPTPITPISSPSITILSPNGGETYKVGEKIKVKWVNKNIPKSFKFDVIRLRDYLSGYEINLAYDVINDGVEEVSFDVPAGAYTLEMKAYYNNVLVMDSSDSYFKITDSTVSTSVDLKVNGSNNPSEIEYGSSFNLTWLAKGLVDGACSFSGHYVPVVEGGLITDYHNQKTSGSLTLEARHSNYGFVSPLEIKIQCDDDLGKSTQASIKIPVSQTVTTPPLPPISQPYITDDCKETWPGTSIIMNGQHNVPGVWNTRDGIGAPEKRFLCISKKIYACGWESQSKIITKVSNGDIKGDYTCTNNKWIKSIPSTQGEITRVLFQVTKTVGTYEQLDGICKSDYGNNWEFATINDVDENHILTGNNGSPIFNGGAIKNTPSSNAPFKGNVSKKETSWPESNKMAILSTSGDNKIYTDVPKTNLVYGICKDTTIVSSLSNEGQNYATVLYSWETVLKLIQALR